ncbi:hypothetical protein QHL1GM_03755 [Halomonas sp. QHL1]|nr:hypothetical protein QHL1GM_03755 [Halomonas sp. QHL1]
MGVEEALLTGMPALPVGSRVARQRLPSGADILAVEVPSARKVRLVAVVGAGYLDEPGERPGLAHLLEHSLFLGSQDSPQPATFAAWVGEQGGRYNAKTNEFVTDYHLSLPPASVQEGLVRLIDLLVCPCLEASTISREIEVIDAEFQARLADPALHRQAVVSRLFEASHPAAHFHAGHRDSLGKDIPLLCEALRGFHNSHYRAERVGLVMLGPESLTSQLKMLEAACAVIPGGAQPINRLRGGRWAPPAYLQWCLPAKQASTVPKLEMLWPLSSFLAEHHAAVLDHALTTLCDGRLAATLQEQAAIADMAATVRPEGTGPALCLTLTLTPRGERCVDRLLATCLSAVRELPSRLVTQRCSYPLISETDLGDYALQLARRLAQPPSTEHSDDGLQCAFDELEACLAPSACRVMEEKQGLDANVEHVPNTLTPFRRVSWPEDRASAGAARLAPRPAPRIALQDYSTPGAVAGSPTVAECLGKHGSFDLWWAGGSGQQDSAWCLGWPAPRRTQQLRLAAWHQHTLALRQAARNAAVTLTLGGDTRGDWLRVQGEPQGLESVASQALAAWAVVTPDSPPGPSQARSLQPRSSQPRVAPAGLLAQRMLAYLEEPFPRHDAQPLDKRILSWSMGWLGPSEYLRASQRLARKASELLDFSWGAVESSHESLSASVAGAPRWLAPQGEDHALMLQIDGPDDTPVSRLLMRLLADAHDSAFFQELRVHQGLGYVAAVRYREADGWPRLGYVVQSPHADIDDLQEAVECFLTQKSMAVARLGEATLARRRDGLRSMQWGPPETPDEAILASWQALRHAVIGTSLSTAMPPKGTALILRPWEAMEHALMGVTPEALEEFAANLFTEAPRQWWYHSPAGNRRF